MKNIDQAEITKFDKHASTWWDTQGNLKSLHDINPLRTRFIADYAELSKAKVLDVGCGGGILTEALARRGAIVTGIDMSLEALSTAKLHALESGLTITYEHITVEEKAQVSPAGFDVVTCLELLEHVPDPASIVRACCALVKPHGALFFSTFNRTPKAYLFGVIGAEYILQLLPKGTHDYQKFIKPSELDAWLRESDCNLQTMRGINYNPFTQEYALSSDVAVNYIVYAKKI